MFIKDILVFIALIFPLLSYAQDDGNKDDLSKDSLQNTASESVSFVKRWGVPVSLMAYGTLEAVMMSKTRMLNYAVGHEVIRHKPVQNRRLHAICSCGQCLCIESRRSSWTTPVQGQDDDSGIGRIVHGNLRQWFQVHGSGATS